MADPNQLELLKRGSNVWNAWREKNVSWPEDPRGLHSADLRQADLRGAELDSADLDGARLSGADFRGASLKGAHLGGAILTYANLHKANLIEARLGRTQLSLADLSEADLSHSNLSDANLRVANLRDAKLIKAHLSGTIFSGADLGGADLSGATLGETVFCDVDLSGVVGLASCAHEGPSVIDHRTLVRSGRLPITFLRGCGLPERLIDYLPSLLESAIHFYSCFISYASEDQAFAERLHADLQDRGVRCWFAPHDVEAGKKLHDQIDEAIRIHEKVLLILSPASMGSEWVRTEIAKARRLEIRQNRRVLFPIRLVDFEVLQGWECFDADIGKDSAREIREYFIPDFSLWKQHDLYTVAFERLLKDLASDKIVKTNE